MKKVLFRLRKGELGNIIANDGRFDYCISEIKKLNVVDQSALAHQLDFVLKRNLDRSLRLTLNGDIVTALNSTIGPVDTQVNTGYDVFGLPVYTGGNTPTKTETVDAALAFIHQDAIGLKPLRLKMVDLKWKYLVRSVLRAKNIMMTGPSGTGKTFAVQNLKSVFPDRPYSYFNLGATQDPRSTLIGNTHFSQGEGTYFSESEFVKAIQQENAIILLDELSRAHPEAVNILMPVLDQSQRYLRLDEADGSPTIKVAKGVCFIATANIGAEYTATRVLDRALLDRFTIIEMDLLGKNDEIELLTEMYGNKVKPERIGSIAEIADVTRQEVKSEDPKVSTIISTRVTVELASLLEDGFTLQEAAEVAIYPFYDDAGGVDSERTFMMQLLQKYVEIEEEDLFNLDSDGSSDSDIKIDNRKPF